MTSKENPKVLAEGRIQMHFRTEDKYEANWTCTHLLLTEGNQWSIRGEAGFNAFIFFQGSLFRKPSGLGFVLLSFLKKTFNFCLIALIKNVSYFLNQMELNSKHQHSSFQPSSCLDLSYCCPPSKATRIEKGHGLDGCSTSGFQS